MPDTESVTESRLQSSDGMPRSVNPSLTLSRRGLVFALLTMVSVGLAVYAMFPESVGGPPLPVGVRLDRQPTEANNGAVVVTDVIVVENKTDHPIPRLTIEINGQYQWFRSPPLKPHESLELPLRVFTDKRSSARFNPAKYPVQEIVVTGQLPSGSRGVSVFEYDLH